ncbi:MAG: DsbA family protein [Syntrophales bacterium LBB04]|nr:DsbA family protein [Syntrophales bacterium LBB04]
MVYDFDLRWTAFPLHPEIPEEGLTLEQLFAGRQIDWGQVMGRLKQAALEAGLPLSDRKMTYNTRLAQELAKWAESKGKGEEFHRTVFQAYFVDGTNLGKIQELIALVKPIGLSEEEARNVLIERRFEEAVDSDWARSRQLGIQAVPTFVLDGNFLVGAQSYEQLVKFVEAGRVRKRN